MDYNKAKEKYGKYKVDTDEAISTLQDLSISIQCWQGDDVKGFEGLETGLTGGILSTGNYPGKASTPAELRQDFEKAISLIPGTHRINLHAMYAEDNENVDRDNLEPKHFENWINWAKELGIGIDFNPSFFSHAKSAELTLTHPNKEIREFWINHGIASRKIAAHIGKEMGTPCLNNLWIPDGYKNTPGNRVEPRKRLKESLDQIYSETLSNQYIIDSVESKFFGIGFESYTAGNHEFYLMYAKENGLIPMMDTGHYHYGEEVYDKISSVSLFFDEMALHVTKAVNWDSDHVVSLSDDIVELAREIVASDILDKVHLGLDFFDGSINRIAAWVLGTRNFQKALLKALLLPHDYLNELQNEGRTTEIMIILEEFKTYPFEQVWKKFCENNNVVSDESWWDQVQTYEKDVLDKRGV